jgi:shikimate kinase
MTCTGNAEGEGFPVRRVLLVGFMGSGKTVVGQALAPLLGWAFRDFDQEICSRVGLPIPEIFREHGEGFFREVEGQVGVDLLLEERVVLASGGGWPAARGRLDALPRGTLAVWLKVEPEEAVRRVREGWPGRPLLAVPDPVRQARDLLAGREAYYAKAHVALDTMGVGPEALARTIETFVNDRRGGTSTLLFPPASGE